MKEPGTSLLRLGGREGCMGRAQVLLLWICCFWSVVVKAQRIDFTTKPANFSSDVSPLFAFVVVAGENGVDPCATSPCAFQCKLDERAAQDCSGRTYSAFNLTEGPHQLDVSATTSNGTSLAPSIYAWFVDSVPPTATVETNPLLTSAINITVNITFSETCSAFKCSNTSCDVVVLGPAAVIPSTFVTLSPGLSYSVQVGLSTLVPEGKVTVTTAQQILCSDVAGNRYERSANSSKVVRFSRVQPTLNLWTPIPNLQVQIRDQNRTVQATNVLSGDVPIYLDFSDPMVANISELQKLLNVSHGVLVPRERKSRSNRRFAFSLLLDSKQATAVTVRMPGNTTVNRYGVPVPETTTVSFLYDTSSPEVLLHTNSRAHTRDRLLPFIVQFSKPVFSFNNLSVTLSGGIVQSFKEISKTTYAFLVWASESSGPVAISVAGNQTQDVAGNANIASSTLQVKHYSSTPAISVALYSFITAGLLGTAFFSGALAVSSANLAAAGMVLGRSRSCPGADASRNLLGMAGHMQVLALTSFLAVSLPVEYAETVNGLQWLIPHISTPWQNNDATNYTSTFAASTVPTTNLSLSRRSLLSSPHGPDPQALMHHWPTPYGNVNCSLYSESVAPTYWSGTYMEDFWFRGAHGLEVHNRRRLGANGTEFGPAVDGADYETYFLADQIAGNLNRLKEELLGEKFNGWTYLLQNIFWLAVIFGSLILLHFLLLLFLRWKMKIPMYTALSFPRFELFLLILALPPICQAAAFVIRGGTKAGIVVGVLLLTIPALLLLMTMWLLIFGIFLGKRVQYKELRPHLQQEEAEAEALPRPPPLSFLTGAGYPGKWTRKETTNAAFIPRFGILFEDRKGPPRLVTMIDDTNANKTATTTVFRRPGINSDEEQDERTVSPAYFALGCFQSAYMLVDLSRRIALGLIFGAFRVTDESWPQVSLVLAVTTAQLLYLIATKPFQRRFVQVVETVSLLCEIGIFIVAMVILAQDRPYDSHWGLGVFMLTLFILSFLAQMTNEWFALIRQLLWFSDTEEIAPVKSVKAFVLGLAVPLLPRSRWPQDRNNTAPAATTTTTQPIPQAPAATATEVASTSRQTSPTKPGKPEEVWPGEDLQEWARQNSLERNRSELAVNPMVQTIAPAKLHFEAPATTAASRTYLRQYSIDIEP